MISKERKLIVAIQLDDSKAIPIIFTIRIIGITSSAEIFCDELFDNFIE